MKLNWPIALCHLRGVQATRLKPWECRAKCARKGRVAQELVVFLKGMMACFMMCR